jgi:hypothetical protein
LKRRIRVSLGAVAKPCACAAPCGWDSEGADGVAICTVEAPSAYRVTNDRPKAPHPLAAVFMLRRGQHRAHLVLAHAAAPPGCGGVPGNLGWDRHHLLYDFGDGRVVVVDLDSGERTSLAALANSIPRREPGESLTFAWASSFAR